MTAATVNTAPLPPRLKALPIIGALPQILTNFPKLLQETAPALGDLVRIPVGGTDLYIVSHPDYLQHMFRDNSKAYARGGVATAPLQRVIGRGLIVLEGQEWLTERRMMQPYFHRKYFPSLFQSMVTATDEIMDLIATKVREANGAPFNLAPFIKKLTITVFLRAMYTMSLPSDTIDKLGDAIDVGMRLSSRRGRLEDFFPKTMRLPGDEAIKESVAYIDQITDGIIAERRKLTEQLPDLLGYMIDATDAESGTSFTDRQLRDECKTLIIGGYDTTSGTLMWLVHLLRNQAAIVARLSEEADRVLGSGLTFEKVAELETSRRVVSETLRLRPVSWANNRVCVEDDVVGGYRIPANSTILFPIMHIQSDPRWWDAPNEFNPDRWADKNGGARHSWAYIPFSSGPRVCLGEHFAMLEATLVTAKLYERFEITPIDAELTDVSYDFTMQPNDLQVTMKLRK